MKTRSRLAAEASKSDTVGTPKEVCEESAAAVQAPAKVLEESVAAVEAPARVCEETAVAEPLTRVTEDCATTVQALTKSGQEITTAVEASAKDSEEGSAMPSTDANDSADGGNLATEAPTVDGVRCISVSAQESVIVISDDEDADCSLGLGNSVLIIEDPSEKSLVEEKRTEELVLDEELAITFTRSGNVMPHARYDCMANPFVRAEHETGAPIENNANVCDQCYCYLCDKPALKCPYWTTTCVCHCNAHNKSVFWKSQRDAALAGILTIFDLDLTEIDADLRQGGFLLLTFVHELSMEYNKYLMGVRVPRNQIYPCTCVCHRRLSTTSVGCRTCILYHTEVMIYSYTDVYNKVEEFLKKAENEKPKTAAVILLGIVKELVFQKEPPLAHSFGESSLSLRAAIPMLLGRILSTLQKMLVLSGFPNNLFEKFIRFYQSLPLPPYCYSFSNSLNILPWDDMFLTPILLGQNVTGHRTKKGKKEFLYEALPVIQARVQKLEEEGNYKHLVRYLKTVRCNDLLSLQCLREKIPFYMCKYGNFAEAAQSLVQLNCASCSLNINISVSDFTLYLKMFRTESCPSGNMLVDHEEWTLLKCNGMKKGLMIKLILRIIYANKTLLQSPQCWSTLIRTWCSSPVLGPKGQLGAVTYAEPNLDFQRSVMDISFPILEDLKRQIHVNLPHPFHVMPNEAELILIVRAFAQKLLFDPKPPASVLEIILAFGKNIWAIKDLLEAITPRNDLVYQFTQKLADELFTQRQIALSTLPWSQQIALFLQSRVSTTCIFFTPAERNELKKKIAACQTRT
ncbi:uncharacterized protein [Ambystoma mexicanum]|uniref:uncharacterized protein isoform X2 n=1 Tax=Ambystoma mexicanum TaxID=8296 RepID=UPI0037E7E17D